MTYRTILVDLAADASLEARLDVARFLALRFDAAALVGLHVTPTPTNPAFWQGGLAVHVPPELVDMQREAGRKARARAREAFDLASSTDPRLAWREAEGDLADALAAAARTADLLVMSAPQNGGIDGLGAAEAVVAATGVPVLRLPARPPRDFGHVVLVGWNGRREAARAAHDALPFLRGAKRVILCAVGELAASSLEEAAAMLARHDVPVRPLRVAGTDAQAGEILLAQAAGHGADLLVVGAFGHSRLREFVFGGATRQVLGDAALPALFSG